MAREQIHDILDPTVNPTVLEDAMEESMFHMEEDESGAVMDVTTVHIPDVITLTARLAQVLAQEADLLEQMKVSAIADLQKEKITLVAALEAQHRQLKKNPQVLEDMDDDDREDLAEVVNVFNMVRDENHNRLQNARAVNHRIVEAIADVVKDANTNGQYDDKGHPDSPSYTALSVTLNEKI